MVTTSTPAGRIGNVEELTGMALYLASAASSFLTGQSIVLDGGLSLSAFKLGG